MKWQVCPICYGRMVLPNLFYSGIPVTSATDMEHETCRTCNGHGMIPELTGMALTTTVSMWRLFLQ